MVYVCVYARALRIMPLPCSPLYFGADGGGIVRSDGPWFLGKQKAATQAEASLISPCTPLSLRPGGRDATRWGPNGSERL